MTPHPAFHSPGIVRRFVVPLACAAAVLSPWHGEAPVVAQTTLPHAEQMATRHARAIRRGRTLIQGLMEQSRVPGLSVAVAVDDEIVWAEGFGYADVENRVPVTPLTKFRIGSVSKPLTSMAIGLLLEEGKLDIDAPIQRYLPDFPEKRWPITVRQLAGHLSGLRNYDYADYDLQRNEFLSARPYASVTEALTIFDADPLEHEPNTKYLYTSHGWNLISAVLEAASGQDYISYMNEHVIGPLRLHDTLPDYRDQIVPFRTRFYARAQDGRLVNGRPVDLSNKWAGGGWLSTPSDLVRWGSALLEPGGLLKRETLEVLWTAQQTADGASTHYGLGWRDDQFWQEERAINHGGGSVGGTTSFVVYPDARVVIAMTVNASVSPMSAHTSQTIAEAFLPGHHARAAEPSSLDILGTFRYRVDTEAGEPTTGVLEIGGSAGGYRGWIRPDTPATQRRAQDGSYSLRLPTEIPLTLVTVAENEAHLIGTDADGFVHVWLRVEGAGFRGRWSTRRASGPFQATRAMQ